MKKFTIIAVILMVANLLFAQIINIPDDYPTLQQGIDAANSGDTILVQPGIYYENIFVFNQTKTFILASLYLTTQDTSYVSQTIIDGNQEGPVVSFALLPEINIVGFTIQNGKSNSVEGAGIGVCFRVAEINLQNLIIKNNGNYGESKGGGISINSWGDTTFSHGMIKDVLVVNNKAHYGGGIFCDRFIGDLQNVTIINNESSSRGGGIYCENFIGSLQNARIENNTSGDHGGGGYFLNSNPTFQNAVIALNACYAILGNAWGAGLCIRNTELVLQNVIVSENNGVGGIFDTYNSNASILNSIFWGNGGHFESVSISYSDIEGGENGISSNNLNWLEGNINEDPLFLGSGDHPYQLSAGSPCIDAGTPDTTGLNLPLLDLMGNYRMWDGDLDGDTIVDMGAYEFGALPVEIRENIVRGSEFEVRSYPNPVSENCTLEFDMAKSARVSIQIYNNMGDLIIEPKNQIYSSGQHQVNLNLVDLKEGIYFCRVKMGNEIVTKKIIKL